jgi:hypothetical protein
MPWITQIHAWDIVLESEAWIVVKCSKFQAWILGKIHGWDQGLDIISKPWIQA